MSKINIHEICYKPYYRAHTKVHTLALLDKRHTGSNWLHLRTHSQPIRTAGEIVTIIRIESTSLLPVYRQIAQKATQLHLLGMNASEIARRLYVDRRTVCKSLRV